MSENATTVRTSDGVFTADVSSGPVNFLAEDGTWQPISNDLVPSDVQGYAVENEGNDFRLLLPEDPALRPVRFEYDGVWVTLKLIGSDSVDVVVDGAEAEYDSVIPSADSVTYEVNDLGVKETINLSSPPVAPVSYAYRITTSPGLVARPGEQGTIEFVDGGGEVKAFIPKGVMVDSSGTALGSSESIAYELQATAGGYKFLVTPDFEWLTDPSRVYPVAVDPSVNKFVQKDCFLRQESPGLSSCGDDRLKVGVTNGGNVRRSLVDFDIAGFPPLTTVQSATAYLYMDAATSGGSGGATSYAMYNPTALWGACVTWTYTCKGEGGNPSTWLGAGGGSLISNSLSLGGSNSDWKGWDVTNRVSGWVDGSLPNRGVLLRQTGENVDKLLSFYSSESAVSANWNARPRLTVTYTDTPPTVTVPAIYPRESPSATTDALPTFESRVTDPEGSKVAACYAVYNNSWALVWSDCADTFLEGGLQPVAMQPGILSVGQTYHVTGIGADGVNWSSSWSPFATFTVGQAAPAVVPGGAGSIESETSAGIDAEDDSEEYGANAPDSAWPAWQPGMVLSAGDANGNVSNVGPHPGLAGKLDPSSGCIGCPDESIDSAGWRACGWRDSRYQVVHDYPKALIHPRMQRDYARLYCGLFEKRGNENVFGYRHILDRHMTDFDSKAIYILRNWRDLAGWTLEWTFFDPSTVTESSPGTRFCYEREFRLFYQGEEVKTMRLLVYTGKTGVRIMTAIPISLPSNYHCKGPVL